MLFQSDEEARAQHDAVRNNIGWYRWTHDLVEVSGEGAGELLDYLYVVSVAQLPIGRSKYTTMLDEAGRIIDDVIISRLATDRYWISTLYAPKLLPWIAKHQGDLQVAVKDLTYEIEMYAVQGPNSTALLDEVLDSGVDDLQRFEIREDSLAGIPIKVHRGGFTGELGFELFCAAEDSAAVVASLREAGNNKGAVELDILEVYVRSLPMEKGFALRQDMYGLTPYEAGLGWSVKLDRDFIGKAALVKAAEEGMQRKLVGLEFTAESYEDISQGERVCCRGRDIGLIKAVIFGYTVEKNIGFAVIDAAFSEPGTKVTVGCNASPALVYNKQWL
jgi:glycine cleavage system aminomethyltransferase T